MAPKARILAIDDQLYSRSFLEGLLAEEGYEVRTAESGPAGLSRLREDGPFDVIIMDLVMPAQDGVATVAELRRAVPDQAIIVLTGVGDVPSVVAAMREGAADYLLKPIERETLLQSIQSVLQQRRMRVENERLVDENLAFMGRLSLFERSLALSARQGGLPELARGLLELVSVEAGQPDGALWARDPSGSALSLVATRGDIGVGSDTVAWKTNDDKLDAQILAGKIVELGSSDGSASRVFVPFVRSGELIGVARLSGEASAARAELPTCQQLGGVLLAQAIAHAQLAGESLRDPQTGLPTRAYLEEVLRTEVHKAHRFGRRLACLCIELRGLSWSDRRAVGSLVSAITRTLRTTDVLCAEQNRRLWVLVTDTDSLGGVVLKRRLAERIGEALRDEGLELGLAVGVASYPLDGETSEQLLETATVRVASEKTSLVHQLGIDAGTSLGDIGQRLLELAKLLPERLVAEAADLLVSELTCRPRDRGMLFFAPGTEANAMLGALSSLSDSETSTEVCIATDGDTVPSGASVTAVALPAQVSAETTWMVRFGEAPPYALIAGPPQAGGLRPIFHTADAALVEHMTFRLRSEVGFGGPA